MAFIVKMLCLVTIAQASNYYPDQPKWQKSITGVRLFELLQHEIPDPSQNKPVHAVTCNPAIRASVFFSQSPVKNTLLHTKASLALVRASGKEIKDVFHVIRSTPTGSGVLDRFLPSFGYKFKVQNMNESVRALFGSRADSIVAAYYPENKTLYYNQRSEVGKAAVALIHEMTHALDTESHHAVKMIDHKKAFFHQEMLRIVSATKVRTRKAAWDLHVEDYSVAELSYLKGLKVEIDQLEAIRSYRTERLAYDVSYQAWQELAKLYPDYYRPGPPKRRLAARQPTGFEPLNFTDQELVNTLRLDATVINRFRSGACVRSTPPPR